MAFYIAPPPTRAYNLEIAVLTGEDRKGYDEPENQNYRFLLYTYICHCFSLSLTLLCNRLLFNFVSHDERYLCP